MTYPCDWSRVKDRVVIGAVLVAALISGLRAAAWIGATVPGFVIGATNRFDRIGDPLWPALRWGLIQPGDRVVGLRIEGSSKDVRGQRELLRAVAGRPPGSPVTYRVEREDRFVEVTIPTARFSGLSFLALYGCAVLPALITFGLAWWVIRRQPQHPASWRFLLIGAIGYMGNLAFCESAVNGRLWYVYFTSVLLVSASFIGFGCYFPQPRAIVRRWPWLPAAAFVVCGGVAAVLIVLQLAGVKVGPLWSSLDSTMLAGSMIVVGVATAHSFWFWQDRETRERARVALFGFAAIPAMLGVAVLPGMMTGSTVPANLFFPLTLIMNGCLAYAIVRGNLFELRHVLRRGSLTTVLGLVWGTVFFTAALALDEVMTIGGVWHRVVQALLVVATGLGFSAARTGLEHFIDRVLFRTRADYKPTVQDLSAGFTRLLRADDVLDRTQAIVGKTIGAGWVEVHRLEGDSPAAPGLPVPLRQRLGGATSPLTRATDAAVAVELEARGAEVALPIAFEGRLRAALLLGPKRSGDLYTSEDLDLLDTIAKQAAIALTNADTFEELDRLRRNLEREVATRTRELRDTQTQLVHAEKMASLGQLVAGVAHELNNPLGAVHGNLDVLRAYLEQLRATLEAYEQAAPSLQARFAQIRERLGVDVILADLARLLATCTEGSERARRIVQDLRAFSRLDEAEIKRIDLNEALTVTLDLLHHRMRGNVHLETDFAQLPPIECYASQLNQVFLNLLTNALDAVEAVGGGVVRVITRMLAAESGDGWVEVAVQDAGPGVPAELRDKIFDPFFTTKPVGKGTGLGLSISYSIVAKHGGRLTLDPSTARGCTFRVALPTRPRLEPKAAAA